MTGYLQIMMWSDERLENIISKTFRTVSVYNLFTLSYALYLSHGSVIRVKLFIGITYRHNWPFLHWRRITRLGDFGQFNLMRLLVRHLIRPV